MLEQTFQGALQAALRGRARLERRPDGTLGFVAEPPTVRVGEAVIGVERAPVDSPAARPETLVAICIETTGGRSERQRILWIGLTRVTGGTVGETFETFVNPRSRVPQHVAKRLSLDLEALDAAPLAAGALQQARDFIGIAALGGHNVRAQLSHLNYELLWHGLEPLANPLIDVQQLIAAHLPALARPTLAGAARQLGLRLPATASALAGVSRLVADVYLRLEQGAGSVASTDGAVHRAFRELPPGADGLPELPGVYVFRDPNDEALYVGKAASLRQRVAQHFTGVSRAIRQDDGLLARVARVEHELWPSELDALLAEADLIERLRPPYNSQYTSHQGKSFLRLTDEPFPRVMGSAGADGPGEFFGPYRTSRAVREIAQTLTSVFMLRRCSRSLPARRKKMREPCIRLGNGLCPAPCASEIDPEHYSVLVSYARAFLRSGGEEALEMLDRRLLALRSTDGTVHSWEVRTLHEVRSRLRRVRREHRPLTETLASHPLLAAYANHELSNSQHHILLRWIQQHPHLQIAG